MGCRKALLIMGLLCMLKRSISSYAGSPVRLVNEDVYNRCSGRVEVYHDGQWGTVCDDYWDLNVARVVCRQLGCGRALSEENTVYFGEGRGPIWLYDVRCTGSESKLTECSHQGFGLHDCGHHEDAGVICEVGPAVSTTASPTTPPSRPSTSATTRVITYNSTSPTPDNSVYINECDNKEICGSNAYCTNLMGNYTCTCQPGYTNLSSSNVNCTDIDECEEDKTHKVCGMKGVCENHNGSYWCKCPSGYTNYGNERTPCSELRCDHFKADSSPAQSLAGLTDILSLMRKSCLALSNSSGEVETTGDVLLETLFTATEDLLSSGHLNSSEDVSGLLGAMEDAVRLIGPQLKGNHTRKETNQTVVELVVRRGRTPPTGPIHLTNEDARLDTYWRTATGNGTYPGFALAALVTYKNLETSVNRSFEQITGQQKDGADPSFQIFSKVVSAVVSNPATQHLNPPVILTLRHLQEREDFSQVSYTCAYWRAGPDGQDEGGAWSTDGCYQRFSNAAHTVCSCDHLSSFAVLMALYPMKDSFELMLLTKLGLIISLLCLVVCILTFKFCHSIQGTRTTIHLHLCLCLFMADLVFLTGISSTKPEGGCRFVAALLHFFFLGVFSWMLLEGVQLYRMVILVFNANIRPLYLFAMGYGTPVVIVVISAISRPDGYGTDKHCWLSLDHGLIWSFFGPVCLIIVLNVFFFIITVWKLAQKFSSLNPDLSKLHQIRAFTVTAIAQMCVLGLMWVFGAFLFQEGTPVAAYIFTILNSLQGALVFLMHCLLSKQVRDEYSKFLCCICAQQKRERREESTNPSSSQSQTQGSWSGQHTGESLL